MRREYSQEEQDQILRKLNAGVIGKRSQGHWDRMFQLIQFSKKEVKEEAKKYKTRTKFYKNSPSHYQRAYKEGWLDEVCLHMNKITRRWTLETAMKEASKYKSRGEFSKYSWSAYHLCKKHNKLDILFGEKIKNTTGRKNSK